MEQRSAQIFCSHGWRVWQGPQTLALSQERQDTITRAFQKEGVRTAGDPTGKNGVSVCRNRHGCEGGSLYVLYLRKTLIQYGVVHPFVISPWNLNLETILKENECTVNTLYTNLQVTNFQTWECAFHQRWAWVKSHLTFLQLYHLLPRRPLAARNSSYLFTRCSPCMPDAVLYFFTFQGAVRLKKKNVLLSVFACFYVSSVWKVL